MLAGPFSVKFCTKVSLRRFSAIALFSNFVRFDGMSTQVSLTLSAREHASCTRFYR